MSIEEDNNIIEDTGDIPDGGVIVNRNISQIQQNTPLQVEYCGKCDHGYIMRDGKRMECLCVLKAKAREYLTPTYMDAKYDRGVDPSKLEGRNILMDTVTQPYFKSLVKSFLLNTGMKYKHLTVTGYDCLQAYLTNTETHIFDWYAKIDFLILYLAFDPRCSSYGVIITSLLEKRAMNKIPTWIFANYSISSNVFLERYGDNLSMYCKRNFVQVQSRD